MSDDDRHLSDGELGYWRECYRDQLARANAAVEDRAVLRQMVEDIANQIAEEGMDGWANNIRDEMRRLGVGAS